MSETLSTPGAAAAAPDAAATAATAAAAAAAAKSVSWFAGADAETIGHLQTHGWHDKPAAEVALAAVKAHREAAKFIGVPPEQLVRLPANQADQTAMASVWERLGAPKDASGYDLSSVKFTDGTELDPAFATFFKELAASYHLPKDTATAVAAQFTKYLDGQEAAGASEKTAELAAAHDRLSKNWGNNLEANKFVAKQAAAALGVTPVEIEALEGLVGYDRVMEMFRNIGARTGEAKFVQGEHPVGNGVMTRDQAVSRRADLMSDKQWRDRWASGDKAAQREMLGLNVLISGDSTGLDTAQRAYG